MTDTIIPVLTAAWLGILTSISPCPLASNIAAISYVGRKVSSPLQVMATGLLYTCGRMLTYIFLGVIFINSLLSAPSVAHFLQKYMIMFLGPLLLLVGLILLGVLNFSLFKGKAISRTFQDRIDSCGILGGGILGIIFAVSFCPTSAALFFGSLLPLALQENSSFLLPAVYGVGTGLPVILFAVLLSFSAGMVARTYNRILSML